ncbi:CLUMA_CG020421, isoform A [Clunio marinus]|uniref:CLUMA_CG020421, isoform A n=1 Tax=Clunio marinus TaxID=568069 RepID=A0A1J1J6N8_9DIPT|nr:CLUMA_CG020421, isoform A [Clunio marinus]
MEHLVKSESSKTGKQSPENSTDEQTPACNIAEQLMDLQIEVDDLIAHSSGIPECKNAVKKLKDIKATIEKCLEKNLNPETKAKTLWKRVLGRVDKKAARTTEPGRQEIEHSVTHYEPRYDDYNDSNGRFTPFIDDSILFGIDLILRLCSHIKRTYRLIFSNE